MIQYKKFISVIFIFLFITDTVNGGNVFAGDNSTYMVYALKVKDFDTTGSAVTKGSDHEITIKNSAGSILRFRVNDKDEMLTYHCGITFIYYEFSAGWINKYKTYDKNGVLKGDDEFNDLAMVEYEIRKMNLLHAKFEVLDAADGNIQMNDKEDEIVYIKAYDSKNKLLHENYITSKEYWNANNVLYRP